MYDKNKGKALQMERANVTVTPEMMLQYVDLLQQMHIEVMIAPGEADAQLAYLYKTKYIDHVISDDSDLIAFGCRQLITKIKTSGV